MARAARSTQLVALAGEPNELHVAFQEPERSEELFCLFDRATKIGF
jgi:hypothetical protein